MHLVPKGTVLIFNSTSSVSYKQLAQMQDVQFHTGGVTAYSRPRLRSFNATSCPTPNLTSTAAFIPAHPINIQSKTPKASNSIH